MCIRDRETMESLAGQRSRLDRQVSAQSRQIDSVLAVLEKISRFSISAADSAPTFDSVAVLFKELKRDYREQHHVFALNRLAVPLLFPLITQASLSFDPLDKEAALKLRAILSPASSLAGGKDCDTYMQLMSLLVSETILPALRKPLLKRWDPCAPEPVVGMFEVLQAILPESLLGVVLDQLIWPRLHGKVDTWDPLQDPVPIHLWLLPWLSMVGEDRMQVLYPTIRQKLSVALELWHPSDPSALVLIRPWKNMFDAASLKSLLSRSIAPKLAMALTEMEINPANQNIEPFKSVMAWECMLPQQVLVRMLVELFFPKWFRALLAWMSNENVDFAQVSQWYMGWKQLISPEIAADPVIKRQLTHALDMMNAVVAGTALPEVETTLKQHLQSLRMAGSSQPVEKTTGAQRHVPKNLSFKEVVESLACENDFVLMPKKRQHSSGKDIYAFGKLSIYFDDCVVYVLDGDEWEPISLEDLVEKAKKVAK
eukprot:TRINITY_DN29819_c0_g1_i1.p1 TRINITY_DN29819_c0_g1~~TRINITY_DN29819_c0_g1_i1.p1  ORF type:complete len:484 (-),score=97.64 TRINITY_DN29819_c0_g1_i1:242-1693(-)